MNALHPAYEIHYREFADEVTVQTFSIDGKAHSGEPRRMKWADVPTLLFQLVDAGYINTARVRQIAYTSVSFFSPAFVQVARQAHQEGD